MSYLFRMAAVSFLLPACLAGASAAQTPSDSVLDPVVPQVKAVVRQAQPRASFALGPDILIGQFRTENTVVHSHDRDGHALPPYVELGPRRRGFFLEISVANAPAPAHPQVTRPTSERPWTAVTSFYPLPDGRTVVMTWEAGTGAPQGLALRVGQVLSTFVSRLK